MKMKMRLLNESRLFIQTFADWLKEIVHIILINLILQKDDDKDLLKMPPLIFFIATEYI